MTAEQSRKIEQLYLEMFDKLYAYAGCSLDSDALAEEAVQETFRIACQKPEQLCESVNPRGWLVQTLKYTIRNIKCSHVAAKRLVEKYLMARSKDLTLSEETLPPNVLYPNAADTEEFKLLVEMVVEGRSHLEMAERRGISVDACKKRVQRAKEALRKIIDVGCHLMTACIQI